MYYHPRVYEIFMKILHGKSLSDRYKIIAAEIGENKKVLDVGCGTSLLANFLYDDCKYSGIDLNKNFIKFARNKGLDVIYGDLLDGKNYLESDVIVVCDVLHHVVPNHNKLIDICKNNSKKLIICEPYKKEGLFYDFLNKIRSNKFFHRLLGESDGINRFEDMLEWNSFDLDKLNSLMKDYGADRIINIGSHLICVIEKK